MTTQNITLRRATVVIATLANKGAITVTDFHRYVADKAQSNTPAEMTSAERNWVEAAAAKFTGDVDQNFEKALRIIRS